MALALLPHNTSFRNLRPSLRFAHTWEKAFSLRDHFNWKLWQPVTETLLEKPRNKQSYFHRLTSKFCSMRWLFGWRLKSQSWGFWWRLESVWVICCLFLQIRSVRPPPIVHPMTTAMLYVNGSPVLWLPSESGQLAASQTDLREEGQRSHCCGVCCILLRGWPKVIHSVAASVLPTTLYFLVLKPSIFLISETPHLPHLFRRWKGENSTTSAQAGSASLIPLWAQNICVGDVSTSKFAISLSRMACGCSCCGLSWV